MRGSGVGAAVAALCVLAGSVPAEPPSLKPRQSLLPKGKAQAVRPVRAVPRTRGPAGVATLQYDNDVPFQRAAGSGFVGNRFNTGFLDPHSISAFSFRAGGGNGGANIGGILDVNPTAMTIQTIALALISVVPASTSGTMVFVVPFGSPVVGHTGSFLGGLANYPVGPGCNTNTMLGAFCNGVALSAGTLDPGMGFHGVRAYTTVTTGVDLVNQNAIFRVTGDNLPVELISLGVE